MNKFALFVLLIFVPVLTYPQNPVYPGIKSVKAFLFYNQDKYKNSKGGTFSENLIGNPDFVLWNTIIGEGSAESSSQNTLIVVEISNSQNDSYVNGFIKLTVKDVKNKIIFNQVQNYSILEKDNIFSAPFLLYDTGCDNIKVKAELLDKTKKKVISVMEKSIEFHCGE